MKMALALLCRGNIEEKYRCQLKTPPKRELDEIIAMVVSDVFSLSAFTPAESDHRDVVDRQRLSILFQQAIVVRRYPCCSTSIPLFRCLLDP